jgi:CRP-like cAMP-binding protein
MLVLGRKTPEKRSLARNEVLFKQGDKVGAIYFVEAGRLRLNAERLTDAC